MMRMYIDNTPSHNDINANNVGLLKPASLDDLNKELLSSCWGQGTKNKKLVICLNDSYFINNIGLSKV